MSDERWRDISRLYDEAAALATVDRAPFLRKACGGDEALRAEIESLLLDDSRVNALLEPKGSHTALIGQRIGSYEIRSLLGVGGMGEVYRARDLKLGRDVAIKVLPVGFASDGERLARFQREARLLASLNHPHIGGIHGFEEASGVPALVLELVEGDTLAERLEKGPIPVSEALHIARQMADALEAAHEHGVVHRDLKPANIKITPDGTVKVLDFGLAKAVQRAESPLQTSGLSHEGLVVGTPAYMSPEQARGKPVDRRADIWAFGCVVYEMLTGCVAFAAATVTDTLAAVLDREPDWSVLPDKTPSTIRRLLRRCLEKDPKLRLRDIGDAALDLREELTSAGVTSAEVRTHKTSRRNLARGIAAGLTLSAIAAALVAWSLSGAPGRQSQLGEVRFVIETPPMPTPHSMAISPDGRTIVLAGANRSTDPNALPMTLPEARLFVRRLGSLQMYPLAGTEGAYHPFWSPDNRSVVFGTGGKLKVVDVNGGEPRPLCDLPGGVVEGGTWNSDNLVVFSTGGVLYRVSSAGGTPAVLARPNRSAGQQNFRWPQFLPDGRRYLYRVGSLQPTKRAVLIGALDSDQTTTVLTGESNAAFVSPDLLLFTRKGALLTQRFELSTLQLMGEPTVLTEDVLQEANGSAAFAVSVSGALAYRTGRSRSLIWIDRSGKASEPFGDLSADTPIRLSPDNKRVAFHEPRGDAADDIYIYDIDRNVTTQLTNNPGTDHYAVWSPDGSSLVFDRHSDIDNVDQGIYQRRADGATPERRILAPEEGAHTGVRDFMRDFLVIEKYKPGQIRGDIWVQPSLSHLTPGKHLQSVNGPVALSPNSRWLAYISDEAGRNVFVQSFPDPSLGRSQISSKGGSSPLWRRDGRELYYIDAGRRLVAVSVRTDGAFAIEGTAVLFSAPAILYDVTADGQRFLFNVPSSAVATPTPITVVLNRANE